MLPLSITLPRGHNPQDFVTPEWAREILLEHRDLARLGWLDTNVVQDALTHFSDRGHAVVLVWDILADDSAIVRGKTILAQLPLDRISAIRVADPGVARFLKSEFPQIPLQLNLETGNHNLPGIQAWVREMNPQRLILSNELPLDQLARIRAVIGVPVEIMALGRILLFYTPRQLISAAEAEDHFVQNPSRFVTSIDDGKHFPLEENRHGTFMYYEKDLFLLPYMDQVEKAGLDVLRLDLKFYPHQPLVQSLTDYFQSPDAARLQSIKACLGPRLTRGFFKSNRTDKQFKKLKNANLIQKDDRDYLGTVVETRKQRYIAQMLEKTIAVGDRLTYQIPEGDLLEHVITWIRDKGGNEVQRTPAEGLWLVNHLGGISPGTRIFRSESAH